MNSILVEPGFVGQFNVGVTICCCMHCPSVCDSSQCEQVADTDNNPLFIVYMLFYEPACFIGIYSIVPNLASISFTVALGPLEFAYNSM